MVGKVRCNYHHIANIENVETQIGWVLSYKDVADKRKAVVLFGKIATYTGVSLEAQLVKNPPAVQET